MLDLSGAYFSHLHVMGVKSGSIFVPVVTTGLPVVDPVTRTLEVVVTPVTIVALLE